MGIGVASLFCFTRSKPEGIPVRFDRDVSKSCNSETVVEAFKWYDHKRVENVQSPKHFAIAAVGSREDASRTQNAADLLQQAILQRWGRHVVKHGETDSTVEASVCELHPGCVLADYFHILILLPAV